MSISVGIVTTRVEPKQALIPSESIDIRRLDKAEVLFALYKYAMEKAASPGGCSVHWFLGSVGNRNLDDFKKAMVIYCHQKQQKELHPGKPLGKLFAESLIDDILRLHTIREDHLDPTRYDYYIGEDGAAAKVIEELRTRKGITHGSS